MQRNNIVRITVGDTLMPHKAERSNDRFRERRMGVICRKKKGYFKNVCNL